MADRYAPALFLEVMAFWFVLRWLLPARLILVVARLLVLVMFVGALATLEDHRYLWAACFVGAWLLALVLLRRWRRLPALGNQGIRVPPLRPWRGKSVSEVAALCERRLGVPVEAAAPAIMGDGSRSRYVLALAGDAVWVLDDESRFHCARIGRVRGCWDRTSLVSHVEHSRRGERFEFSWPRHGALVRGVMSPGPAAELVTGHLAADEFRR